MRKLLKLIDTNECNFLTMGIGIGLLFTSSTGFGVLMGFVVALLSYLSLKSRAKQAKADV